MRRQLIALGVCLLAASGCTASHPPSTGGPALPHIVTVARNGRSQAEMELVSGTETITVAAAKLGSALMRAITPPNSAIAPVVTDGDATRVSLHNTGRHGPSTLEVLLNSSVTWRLVFTGGSEQTSVDLSHGQFASADFAAGSAHISLRLPRPHGTAGVVIAGGASQVTISVAAGFPTRVQLGGGTASATVAGRSHHELKAGTVLDTPGWQSARNRYDIDATAGISTITVS